MIVGSLHVLLRSVGRDPVEDFCVCAPQGLACDLLSSRRFRLVLVSGWCRLHHMGLEVFFLLLFDEFEIGECSFFLKRLVDVPGVFLVGRL